MKTKKCNSDIAIASHNYVFHLKMTVHCNAPSSQKGFQSCLTLIMSCSCVAELMNLNEFVLGGKFVRTSVNCSREANSMFALQLLVFLHLAYYSIKIWVSLHICVCVSRHNRHITNLQVKSRLIKTK